MVEKFHDGQILVTSYNEKEEYVFRINSYEDLIALKSLSQVVNLSNKRVVIPYLFGSRSDRKFEQNQNIGLKVITDIINSCNIGEVIIFDPHSDVAPALLNNCKVNDEELDRCVSRAVNRFSADCLISPDAGAYKKNLKYSYMFNLPLFPANKARDGGGFNLQFEGDVKGKRCLILDDLCSRGGTFSILADKLYERGAEKVSLYVSHFEGGVKEYKKTIERLTEKIDILTTDSFRERESYGDLSRSNGPFYCMKIFVEGGTRF